MIDELAALLDRAPGRDQFMDWDLKQSARSLVAFFFAILLITSTFSGFLGQKITGTSVDIASAATPSPTEDWSTSVTNPNGVAFSPDHNLTFVADDSNGIYAYNKSTAEQAWTISQEYSEALEYNPVDGNLYALVEGKDSTGSYSTFLWQIDPETGDITANKTQLVDDIDYNSDIIDIDSSTGDIYIAAQTGVTKVNHEDLTETWTHNNDNYHAVDYSSEANLILFGTNQGAVGALSESGSLQWKNTYDTSGVNDIEYFNNSFYAAIGDGNGGSPIYKINTSGGQIWKKDGKYKAIATNSKLDYLLAHHANLNKFIGIKPDKSEDWRTENQGRSEGLTISTNSSTVEYYSADDGQSQLEKWDTEQSLSSTVSGTVIDESGNPIDQASVEIVDDSDGSTVFTGSTDGSGDWSTELGDGTYTVTAEKSGYTANSSTFDVAGSAVTEDLTLTRAKTISGYVTDQNGEPVSNATVEIVGVDTSTLDPDAGQTKLEKADELLSEQENPLPDSWESDPDLTGPDGEFTTASDEYVALHSPEEWGSERWSTGVNLERPTVNPPAGEEFVISVWNPNAAKPATFRDDADSDLPGKTVNRSVTIERIDALEGVVDTQTYELNEKRQVGATRFAKQHSIKTISLPAGVYRISPDGSKYSQTIVVGDPADLRESFATDIRDKRGDLTKAAEDLQEKFDSGTFVRSVETANESGYYETTVYGQVERVAVSAYRIDGEVLLAKENATPQDMRTWVTRNDYNGSVYFSTEPNHFEPPTDQADVSVYKFSEPPYAALDDWASSWAAFRDRMETDTLTELGSVYEVPLSEWNETKLEDGAEKLSDVMTDDMIDEWEEQRDQDWETFTDELENQERRNDELREDIRTMEETIESLRDELSNDDSETDVEDETAIFRNVYDGDFNEDDVTATWRDYNGSVRPIGDDHITVNKRVGRGDEVTVEYPIPNGSTGGSIAVLVVDEDGNVGRDRGRFTNPTAQVDVPELRSIDVSTLQPGVGETVTIDSNFETAGVTLESVEVWHDGAKINASNDGGLSASFTPEKTGEHVVRLTYNTSEGDGPFVETIRVQVRESPDDYPARVYARNGNLGVFAVAADQVDDAAVEIEQSGGTLDVTGMVAPGSAVNELHVHVEDAPSPPEQDVTVRVVEGDDFATATSIGRHAGVYVHGRELADGAILYRKGTGSDESKRPITRDGDTRGGEIKADDDGGDVVHSYAGKNGEVTIDVNNDPGRFDRLAYWWNVRTDDWSVLTIFPPIFDGGATGASSSASIGLVGIVALLGAAFRSDLT